MLERERKIAANTIAATQARIHLAQVLKRVYNQGEHWIVEKDGLPVAVIVSYADYERYRGSWDLANFAELSRTVNKEIKAKGWTEEQVLQSVDEAQRKVFKERYGRTSKGKRSSRHG